MGLTWVCLMCLSVVPLLQSLPLSVHSLQAAWVLALEGDGGEEERVNVELINGQQENGPTGLDLGLYNKQQGWVAGSAHPCRCLKLGLAEGKKSKKDICVRLHVCVLMHKCVFWEGWWSCL